MEIKIMRFNKEANRCVNNASDMAIRYGHRDVTTVHIGLELLSYSSIADDFYRITGVKAEDFCKDYLELALDSDIVEKIELDEEGKGLGVANLSSEINMLMGRLIDSTSSTDTISPMDLYKALMYNEETFFHNIMSTSDVDLSLLASFADLSVLAPMLCRVSDDITALARDNELDPVESRDDIVNTVIEVLGRRQQGNPCLIGEPGVGKTAIIEGLAQRIADGKVPKYLLNSHILSVNIAEIVSGCKMRGDFEEKFGRILEEAVTNTNIIMFFDEFHMLLKAGASGGEGITAGNMLKPLLARGDIRLIGATTNAEYKKYIEGDSAFTRRIQTINVAEPNVAEAIKIVSRLVPTYSMYHNVVIQDNVVESIVRLSDRYITTKKLPDKAITLLDSTSARLKAVADNIKVTMTEEDVKETISRITGIDVSNMDKRDKNKLLKLEGTIKRQLIGQDKAIEEISKAIKRNKVGIRNSDKPIGAFLFIGPTGVGKTELCKILAKELFTSEKDIIRFDMSEFMDSNSVSKLIGAPPGYIGFDGGGQLTDRVKLNPYSIILLDEIEKAHADIYNIFLQIMDDGRLTDNKGVTVDFKNTIIIMTSNAGCKEVNNKKSIGFNVGEVSTKDKEEDINFKSLSDTFAPEFLNRLDKVIRFNSLDKVEIKKIVRLMLNKVSKNIADSGISITFTDSLVSYIAEEGFSAKYGARNVRRKIQDLVEDYVTDLILADTIVDGDSVKISVRNGVMRHSVKAVENTLCNCNVMG